jgi:hypothetical protein
MADHRNFHYVAKGMILIAERFFCFALSLGLPTMSTATWKWSIHW